MTRTVRVRMFPDREIQVEEAEYVDLARQGLLVSEPAADSKTRRAPAPPADKED